MKPGTKKWIATSLEIASVIAFAGLGFLASDEIKQAYRNGLSISPPNVVWFWIVIGIFLGVTRYLTSRYGRQETLGILSTSSFVEAYKETLESSIRSLVTVLRTPPDGQKELLDAAAKAVLEAITNVVDYFRNATALTNTSVNCVLMEPRPYSAEVDGTTQILGLEPGGREHLKYVLSIVKMAREQIEIPIINLPVYDLSGEFRNKNPLGAPRTFVTREKQLINCTLWLKVAQGRKFESCNEGITCAFLASKGQVLELRITTCNFEWGGGGCGEYSLWLVQSLGEKPGYVDRFLDSFSDDSVVYLRAEKRLANMKPSLSVAEAEVELLQQAVQRFRITVDQEKAKTRNVFNAVIPLVFSLLGALLGILTLFGMESLLK